MHDARLMRFGKRCSCRGTLSAMVQLPVVVGGCYGGSEDVQAKAVNRPMRYEHRVHRAILCRLSTGHVGNSPANTHVNYRQTGSGHPTNAGKTRCVPKNNILRGVPLQAVGVCLSRRVERVERVERPYRLVRER
jgi:hypothetical protein